MKMELFAALSHNLEAHEGRKLSMYLCPAKVVTCGIGHALFAPVDATRIVWWRSTNQLATREDILAAYHAVKTGNSHHTLLMSHEETDRVLRDDLIKFERVVYTTFPEYEAYPLSVQVAIYDIVFTCGSLLPHGDYKGWPHFISAIRCKDWKYAADESYRPACGAERNRETRNQLLGVWNYTPEKVSD